MDTRLKIYLLFPFFHLTYCDRMPIDYNLEALKILDFEEITSPSPGEKRLAKRLAFEHNEVEMLKEQLAVARHEKKVAEMELCLMPSIETAGKLVVPQWLSGMDWFPQSTTWVISMALGLTPIAKILMEDLTSHGISLPEFEIIFDNLYGLFSKNIAHGKRRKCPKDFKEEDWEVIYRKTGIDTDVDKIALKTILATLDRFEDMQYLQYTTTTVSPRVHYDIILLIREKLPFKGDGNVESWESTFRGVI